MPEKPFDEPRIALTRIYTRRGDAGQTSLAGGQRVAKDTARVACYGTVDELSAFIGLAGVAAAEARLDRLAIILRRVQHELFNLGSLVATLPEDVRPRQPRIGAADVERLEREIDEMNAGLPRLESFVLAGGCRLNAELHAARTICRRAERQAVTLARQEQLPDEAIRYLNRLSDALFVWSRWASRQLGADEVLWQPNEPASGI